MDSMIHIMASSFFLQNNIVVGKMKLDGILARKMGSRTLCYLTNQTNNKSYAVAIGNIF